MRFLSDHPSAAIDDPREEAAAPIRTVPAAHRGRRVQDHLIVAAHRACDEKHLSLARKLLRLGEEALSLDPDPRRRRQGVAALIAAHERLWHLRHPDHAQDG